MAKQLNVKLHNCCGKWKCRYRNEVNVTCKKKGKPKRRITFRLV